MKAKVVNDYINLQCYFLFEGVWFGETGCRDYDDFRQLPSVIEVEVDGRKLSKSGWNSDKEVAYYRDDRVVGRAI